MNRSTNADAWPGETSVVSMCRHCCPCMTRLACCNATIDASRSQMGGETMAVRFGVFVPQGWRLDLVEIRDPVEQFEAMTAVARAVDADPAWDSIWVYDHFHTVPEPELETTFE